MNETDRRRWAVQRAWEMRRLYHLWVAVAQAANAMAEDQRARAEAAEANDLRARLSAAAEVEDLRAKLAAAEAIVARATDTAVIGEALRRARTAATVNTTWEDIARAVAAAIKGGERE